MSGAVTIGKNTTTHHGHNDGISLRTNRVMLCEEVPGLPRVIQPVTVPALMQHVTNKVMVWGSGWFGNRLTNSHRLHRELGAFVLERPGIDFKPFGKVIKCLMSWRNAWPDKPSVVQRFLEHQEEVVLLQKVNSSSGPMR